MTDTSLGILAATAATIGVVHTVTGPDHYVPFIAMSKVGRWSLSRTALVTLACGLGHVVGSVVLGMLGIAVGLSVGKLEVFEGVRASLAAWLLLGFGLAYTAWGIRRALRQRPHSHWHAHDDGTVHCHEHAHTGDHAHVHAAGDGDRKSLTPWVLFAIFVFGPCEPLIPILMYPAAELSVSGVVVVTLVFAACTLATMLGVVLVGCAGLSAVPLQPLTRYGHALAGLAISVCGLGVHLGL